MGARGVDRVGAGVGGGHLVPGALEVGGHHARQRLLIIDHQHASGRQASARVHGTSVIPPGTPPAVYAAGNEESSPDLQGPRSTGRQGPAENGRWPRLLARGRKAPMTPLTRRTLLTGGVTLLGAGALSACTSSTPTPPASTSPAGMGTAITHVHAITRDPADG